MSRKSVFVSSVKAIESARVLESIISDSASHVIRYLGKNKEVLATLIENGKITDWDTYLPQGCDLSVSISMNDSSEFIQFAWEGYYTSVQDHVSSSFKIDIDTFLELEETVRNQ